MSEHDLLTLFIRQAPLRIPSLRVFRRNIINRTVTIEGRKVHLVNGIPGQGDAYALLKGGRHVEIETKAATGRMRAGQVRWQAFCAAWGIPHLKLQARRDESAETTVDRWIEDLRGAL